MAEQMIAKYLGNNCPTTPQLAAFVATRIKEFLPAGALDRIMEDIHEHGGELEDGVKEVNLEVMKKADQYKEEEVREARETKGMAKIVDSGAGDTDLVQKGRFLDEKEVIMRFLAFTKFPEEFRDKMVEAFIEQSV